MKKRAGFTLTELIVATMISGFIAVSMITIYSTTNRHVFQNYRGNTVKSDAALGMRAIRNAMAQATRIEAPAQNSTGGQLLVIANMDKITNCYPMAPAETVNWYLFCTVNVAGNVKLFFHSGTIAGACACPGSAAVTPATCAAPNIVVNCGANQSNVMQLTQFLNTSAPVFSRSWTLGDIPAGDNLSVRVRLRSVWTAAGRGSGAADAVDFSATQRNVDTSLDSTFTISSPGN